MTKRERIEKLAQILHESGRKAVEQRKLYRNDLPVKPFCEWNLLPEDAREGRRLMAAYLYDGRRAPGIIDLLAG